MWIIGSTNEDSKDTLGEQFSSMQNRTIMSPEQANYDVKKLLKK